MCDSLLSQLTNLRQLFAEAAPTDPKVISDYCWTNVKMLLQHTEELGSTAARQFLADCMKLPLDRPSKLYSALLSAAVKVAKTYPDFRFAKFLNMWDITNLRPEDHQRQQATVPTGSPVGKTFPSLAEKVNNALAHSLLLHPEDELTPSLVPLMQSAGYVIRNPKQSSSSSSLSLITPMLVTRIKQAVGKDGRKYTFVTLTSPEGLEVETTSHTLQPSPLHPLPEGKRHYANIGQLYDCLLKTKATVPAGSPASIKATVPAGSPSGITLTEAVLSLRKPTEVFPTAIGYIESIDQQHLHMHIYDSHSRHLVAPVQRFSREKAGDFIRFIPIVPAASKFKTAIIQGTVPTSSLSAPVPSDSSEGQPILREIRITHVNQEKGYAAWELTDKTHPITELLSPLQLSQGETSPSFTSGYLNLPSVPDASPSDQTATVPAGFPAGISLGQTLHAFIYLRRGKDRQKRPHIARLFP